MKKQKNGELDRENWITNPCTTRLADGMILSVEYDKINIIDPYVGKYIKSFPIKLDKNFFLSTVVRLKTVVSLTDGSIAILVEEGCRAKNFTMYMYSLTSGKQLTKFDFNKIEIKNESGDFKKIIIKKLIALPDDNMAIQYSDANDECKAQIGIFNPKKGKFIQTTECYYSPDVFLLLQGKLGIIKKFYDYGKIDLPFNAQVQIVELSSRMVTSKFILEGNCKQGQKHIAKVLENANILVHEYHLAGYKYLGSISIYSQVGELLAKNTSQACLRIVPLSKGYFAMENELGIYIYDPKVTHLITIDIFPRHLSKIGIQFLCEQTFLNACR